VVPSEEEDEGCHDEEQGHWQDQEGDAPGEVVRHACAHKTLEPASQRQRQAREASTLHSRIDHQHRAQAAAKVAPAA
jgi:hypothetical protein